MDPWPPASDVRVSFDATQELDDSDYPARDPASASHQSTPGSDELSVLRARVEMLTQGQRLLEEQVRHLHRAKTLSDLLAGVAHDLSGALTGILWCSEALRRRVSGLDPDLGAGLADFVGAADYARKLARRLISIGRQRDSSFSVVCLHDAVSEALLLLDSLRPGNVRLVAELDPRDACIYGNSDELQQIVVNLVTNAFDALAKSGGSVRVTLALTSATSDLPDGWISLRVQDTGEGMSAATLRRAFEPFFTTKSAQDGSGLGLVVVRAIVQRHGGKLVASSSPGAGTTMDISLPLSQGTRAP